MTRTAKKTLLAGGAVCAFLGIALYLLAPILTPFILGFVLAYFLDPLADRLESWGLPRLAAVIGMMAAFLCALFALVAFGAPFLAEQLGGFFAALPQKFAQLQAWAERIGIVWDKSLWQEASDSALALSRKGAAMLFQGGLSVIYLLGLALITPIVAVYMLHDWDKMLAQLDKNVLARCLPRAQAAKLRQLMREMDEVLAAFARGQLLVCLLLGLLYSAGLFWIGLDGALVVGLLAGALSFVPYAGTLLGAGLGLVLALAQFGPEWTMLLLTAGVFALGQFLEGNFLSPFLVGDRVALHPVWVIFALTACGYLFGFLGLLLAVPLAAAVGVLVRFGLRELVPG